jgi:TM2 domain-containing membrane protein YozV
MQIPAEPQQLWSPGIAAVLSFFVPGLGQLYKKQIFHAICWFILVPVGYFFFVIPGVILHLFCIIGATMGDPTRYR